MQRKHPACIMVCRRNAIIATTGQAGSISYLKVSLQCWFVLMSGLILSTRPPENHPVTRWMFCLKLKLESKAVDRKPRCEPLFRIVVLVTILVTRVNCEPNLVDKSTKQTCFIIMANWYYIYFLRCPQVTANLPSDSTAPGTCPGSLTSSYMKISSTRPPSLNGIRSFALITDGISCNKAM